MSIDELATAHIGDGSTTAITSNVEKPTIELKSLERNILTTAANPYYHRGYIAHVADALDIDENKVHTSVYSSIKSKLDISSHDTIFTALCIALKDGVISIDEILDGKDLAEELPRFKAALRKLSRSKKHILAEFYNRAVYDHSFSRAEVAKSLHYTHSQSIYGRVWEAYKILGIHNRAQLAFFAHIYMHFMYNQAEEQLTGKRLDALEAMVVKAGTRGMYKADQDGASNRTIYSLTNQIRNRFNAETSMETVLKALDMGFYTLLLEADIPAFVSLNENDIDFLKAKPETVAVRENHNIRSRIYQRLDIHTMPQLAPYLFLAAKLDEHEMDSLRSAHASPDRDPMKIIYEKFGIPEGAALLAPSKYLAAKREMAANN
ncbi:MAG: hypothetical protein AABX34_03515 [Nanoarchaeota archaeon]